jgi:hypothetical protein
MMLASKIISYPPWEQLSPDGETLGKFIQFRWRGIEYLLFATRETHRFHNQMLAHFLDEHSLPHRWLDDQHLEIEADDLQIIGGGRFRLVQGENLLELWDNSQAYGRFDEEGLAEKIRTAGHPWSASRVVIR